MITQSDFPQTIRADLEVAYSEGLKKAVNRDYLRLVEIVPSSSNAKEEVFYGDTPRLRRWKGEKQPTKFYEYKQVLKSEPWELTRTVLEADINRAQDKQGFLVSKISSFADDIESSKEQEFWEHLRNGSSRKGFDKDYFYSFVHSYVDVNGATVLAVTQNNMHLGGSQLDATTLQLERQHYAELVTDRNQKFGLQLTDIAVFNGSANHKTAMELNNSTFTVEVSTVKGQMTDNVFKGSLNIIPTSYGIGASEWISFALNMPEFKPVKVLSETSNPGFDNFRFVTLGLDGQVSDSRFWRGDVSYSVEGYFGYNYGYWFTSRLHGSSSYTYTPADFENQTFADPNA